MTERTLQHGTEARVREWVRTETAGMGSVLDLGAGRFNYIRVVDAPVRTGIESFLPYVEEAKMDRDLLGVRVIHDDMRRFPEPTWWPHDCVMMIDSLEHLTRSDALELLGRLTDSCKKVIVFCPKGDHPQEPCDGNEAQRHLSTWEPEDFEAIGFEVRTDPDFHEPGKGAIFAVWTR